jgi:hypothetical protein
MFRQSVGGKISMVVGNLINIEPQAMKSSGQHVNFSEPSQQNLEFRMWPIV